MSVVLTINGQSFDYPEQGDQRWGGDATSWAEAVTSGMLQKAGGLFQLLAEVDLGSGFGIKSIYFKSRSSNVASAGSLRLSTSDEIRWRNAANSGDLILSVGISDNLLFNGSPISPFVTSVSNTSTIDLTVTLGDLTADLSASTLASIAAKLPLAGGTMTGSLILNADPVLPLEAATKQYVDNLSQGLDAKQSVVAATTGNITLSGAQTIDGVSVVAGNRVLVKNQSAPAENGLYVCAAGAWSRSADADTWDDLVSAYVFVEQGTTLADTGWLCTVNAGGTLGTTPVTFVQFSSAGVILAGSGLVKTGNTLDVQVDNSTIEISTNQLRVKGVTGTELGYLAGVTSSIQTQLDTKITNPMTTGGDIIYGGASGTPTRLANGSAGQVLTSQGGTSAPVWAAAGTPGTSTKTGNYTIVSGDSQGIIFCDTSGGAFNLTLPTPTAGFRVYIKDKAGTAGTNNITLVRAGSEQIEGIAASKILQTNWGSWTIVSDGTNWFMM